jgi:hypothetical protein
MVKLLISALVGAPTWTAVMPFASAASVSWMVLLPVLMALLDAQRKETEGRWTTLRSSALKPRYWIALGSFMLAGAPQNRTLKVVLWATRVCWALSALLTVLTVALPVS